MDVGYNRHLSELPIVAVDSENRIVLARMKAGIEATTFKGRVSACLKQFSLACKW